MFWNTGIFLVRTGIFVWDTGHLLWREVYGRARRRGSVSTPKVFQSDLIRSDKTTMLWVVKLSFMISNRTK